MSTAHIVQDGGAFYAALSPDPDIMDVRYLTTAPAMMGRNPNTLRQWFVTWYYHREPGTTCIKWVELKR